MALDYNARVIPNLINGAVEVLFNSCCSIFYKGGSSEEKINLFKEEYNKVKPEMKYKEYEEKEKEHWLKRYAIQKRNGERTCSIPKRKKML